MENELVNSLLFFSYCSNNQSPTGRFRSKLKSEQYSGKITQVNHWLALAKPALLDYIYHVQ